MWYYLLFIPALLIEGTVTILPLVLNLLLIFYVRKRDALFFTLAFFLGLLLDSMLAHPLGKSSLFFVAFLFVVGLYERKFETKSPAFVFLALLLGGGLYSILITSFFSFGVTFVNALLFTFVYLLFSRYTEV